MERPIFNRATLRLRRPAAVAGLSVLAAVAGLWPGGTMAGAAPGTLRQRADAQAARASALSSRVAGESRQVASIQGSRAAVERRLAGIQADLDRKRAALAATHAHLLAARHRLDLLQRRLAADSQVLARTLRAAYESGHPDAVTVILEAHGFADLLERLDMMKRVQKHNGQVLAEVRAARRAVIRLAIRLGALQVRQQRLAAAVLASRNQVARIRLALVSRQIAAERARAHDAAALSAARSERSRLLHRMAALAAAPAPSAPSAPSSVAGSSISSSGGFTFPMPKSAACPPSTWSEDQGVDICAPGGTPLLAVGNGTIVLHGIGGFGPSAPVLHLDSGRYIYYGHAGPGNMVPVGTHVSAGQVISEVGAGIVGISTGPHLEIGFADGNGTPVGGTSGEMHSLLLGAYG